MHSYYYSQLFRYVRTYIYMGYTRQSYFHIYSYVLYSIALLRV